MSVESGQELKENIQAETNQATEQKAEEVINWYEQGAYDGRVVNIEKSFAVLMEKPFDPKYRMYAFGGSALFAKEDGTFSEDYDERCPSLSLNAITNITDYLFKEKFNDVTILENVEDLPFDINLFYDKPETAQMVKDAPKIIVTFKDSEVDTVYAVNIKTEFQYKDTLIVFERLFEQKRNEIDRNALIQNLFMALQQANQQRPGPKKSEGGVVLPG